MELNVDGEGIHGLETTDWFAVNLLKKMDHKISVLWFFRIIFFVLSYQINRLSEMSVLKI